MRVICSASSPLEQNAAPPPLLNEIPGNVDHAHRKFSKLFEQSGGHVDTVTGTAGAFVNDHRLGRLPTITYINFLATMGSWSDCSTVHARRNGDDKLIIRVLVTTSTEAGSVIGSPSTVGGASGRISISGIALTRFINFIRNWYGNSEDGEDEREECK